MTPDVAVVGGGLVGRLFAWRAAKAGLKTSLYDGGSSLGEASAAWAAAGMISPATEAAEASIQVGAMGRRSLELWPAWLAELPLPVFFQANGTLVLWHREEAGEAVHFEAMVGRRDAQSSIARLTADELYRMEPRIRPGFREALYLPNEAQLDNRGVLKALAQALEDEGVACHWNALVDDENLPIANTVVDCRGMGAGGPWPQLRGVRGEIARLHAPEIELTHMVRLLSARASMYVAPRPDNHLVLGATSVESDDRSPVSVRGALELLSAAYSVLPALVDARILEFASQVRPTLPDNLPAFQFDRPRRVLRINGLYRHGFLLSPTVVEEALKLMLCDSPEEYTGAWDCLRVTGEAAHASIVQEVFA